MVMLKRDTSTMENKEFWDYVEKVAARVKVRPAWKRGETPSNEKPEGEKNECSIKC